MKQTRRINISDLVFTSSDLRRISKIFESQEKSEKARPQIAYAVEFDDRTLLESDMPEIFSDESLTAPARPIAIKMSFHDFSAGHHVTLSVKHGDTSYRYANEAVIASTDQAWLSTTFLALKEALAINRTHDFWFYRHRTLLLNLIALGIGNLVSLVTHLIIIVLDKAFEIKSLVGMPSPDSLLHFLITLPLLLQYFLIWILRWLNGFLLGAFIVRSWLLAMWPSIEFDFGLPHLQIEKRRRDRLRAVGALILLPIIVAFLYDSLKALW